MIYVLIGIASLMWLMMGALSFGVLEPGSGDRFVSNRGLRFLIACGGMIAIMAAIIYVAVWRRE